MKILNAFSLSMLPSDMENGNVSFAKLCVDDARENARYGGPIESCIGHADTAGLFSNLLRIRLETNRVSVKLEIGEAALVGQYNGPRLPEGTTVLPEGASIDWFLVTVKRRQVPAPRTEQELAAQAAAAAEQTARHERERIAAMQAPHTKYDGISSPHGCD